MFNVQLQQFSGPLQVLLELIEHEKLPITDVSLATVTDDYVRYVNEHDVPTEELADFLIVATKLLYIKSKAILPIRSLEEEEDPNALAAQLKMYKAFVDAAKGVEALYAAGHRMFEREKPMIISVTEFAPPQDVTSHVLRDAFHSVLKRLEPFFALRQASMRRIVSVQERMREIREVILERSRLTFGEVVKGATSKVDVVVSFLALLELVKQRVVRVVQPGAFQDIVIKHVE